MNHKPCTNYLLEQQLGAMLIKWCDKKAERKCTRFICNQVVSDVEQTWIATPIISNKIIDKNTNNLIREIDAKDNWLKAIKDKVKENTTT